MYRNLFVRFRVYHGKQKYRCNSLLIFFYKSNFIQTIKQFSDSHSAVLKRNTIDTKHFDTITINKR